MQASVQLDVPRRSAAAAICSTLLLVLALLAADQPVQSAQGSDSAHPAPDYGDLPLSFQPAAGRYEGIDYLSSGTSGLVAVGPEGLRFEQSYGTKENPKAAAIAMSLPGGTLTNPQAHARQPGVVNDLRGDDPAEHVTSIPTFASLSYAEVWSRIDLTLRGSGANPEYDFELAPGADPSLISMRIAGADSARIARSGDLVIRSGGAIFRQHAPVSYQPSPEGRVPVDSAFRLDGRSVSFELGAYDADRRLVIDPMALAYSTYLGGNGADGAQAIAVDSSGAAYVAGFTDSGDFNTVGPINTDKTPIDAFIAKLTPAGNALAYSTYLGGNGVDIPTGIAVDSSGAAYVTGSTDSTDFDTNGQIEGDSNVGDAFIAKLTPAGSALAYSTYLGGNDNDAATGIAVDSSGAAYVTGYTASSNFNTVGQIEADSAGVDAFIAKLTPAGNALAYSTYLGGSGGDAAAAIAVDAGGSAYVAGYTDSSDFNTSGQIEGDSGGIDAFVTKLNPAGSALAYSTYLGGSGEDRASAIAVDSSGAAYVAGGTASTDFDLLGNFATDGGGVDGFVAKLTPAGNALAYSTYLGGNGGIEGANAIAVDSSGAAYVAGATDSTDFHHVGQIEGYGGSIDGFIVKLTPAGNDIVYASYLGGNGLDSAMSVAVDSSGAAYVAGFTRSTDFVTVGQIEGDSAIEDGFISKIAAPDTRLLAGPGEGSTTGDPTATFAFSSDSPSAGFQCRIDAGPWQGCGTPQQLTALSDGAHTFGVRAADDLGDIDLAPAFRTFSVDTTPPDTKITKAPRKLLLKKRKRTADAVLLFEVTEPGSQTTCRVDGKTATPCTSPLAVKLKKGTHEIAITATDGIGNADLSPAGVKIKVKKKKRKR